MTWNASVALLAEGVDRNSDTGKSEPNSYTMTFTLPEEVHEAMDKYIDENPAGKVELAQLLVNKAKGLI